MKKTSKLKKFWHTSDGEFKVPYFWATLFLSLFFVGTGIHIGLCIYRKQDFTPILGILAGLVMGLIYLYNQGKDDIQTSLVPEEEVLGHGARVSEAILSSVREELNNPEKMERPEEWPEYSICEECYWYNKKDSYCTLSSDMMGDCVNSGYKEHFKNNEKTDKE